MRWREAGQSPDQQATSVLVIPGVDGYKVRVLHRVRDTTSAEMRIMEQVVILQ